MGTMVVRLLNNKYKILLLCSLLLLSFFAFLLYSQQAYISHKVDNGLLIIESDFGQLQLSALAEGAIEVHYLQSGVQQLPSFAKSETVKSVTPVIENKWLSIGFSHVELTAEIRKSDLTVSFYRGAELLTRQKRYFLSDINRGFDFELDATEKILGGGMRVLGMDRRGQRMPLYNRAHYAYSTQSNQMNFSLPLVMSSKKYAILFDNTAKGTLDIGQTEANTLTFEAVAGRTAYMVFGASSYPELINHYVDVTGKQPMPPRWAFGHFLSRFGYRTEQQLRKTVNKTLAEDFPVDTVILDLYWFGPDIKGHVGNLAWDENAFPTHQKMIDDFQQLGIKTILITEPFILSSSSKWQDAVDSGSLIKHPDGSPYRFDFYFGNTGLIDVFDDNARQWFWNIYRDIFAQGIAGTWGDLGEPEVHPDDALHYLSDIKTSVRADAIHNAYGHQWAKLVYENQIKLQPDTRPFIMMRSGFPGSQRYGMIPWTGDVDRSWGGLQPQVELSLQMGLFGLAYTHSDLGGFVVNDNFQQEMYIRWLQYGVFQPIYRPHAQDFTENPPEVVYQSEQVKTIIRKFIKLRYQLLPYNYTLAYQNATSGMPLMRPLFFEDEEDPDLIDNKDDYLWGNNFLVSPIVQPGVSSQEVQLPKGIWFDYWNGKRYQGGKKVALAVSLETIPVLVRAGSFIPMVEAVKTTRDYSSKNLSVHYFADSSITQSSGFMYEDDGHSFDAITGNKFELLNFSAEHKDNNLMIEFSRTGSGYEAMPEQRNLQLVIHQWLNEPTSIVMTNRQLKKKNITEYTYNAEQKRLTVSFSWAHDTTQLIIR